MRVKLEWLNEFVNISDLSTEELVHILSLHSIEIENVDHMAYGTDLVVGHVLSRIPHPDSDHLSVCQVDTGTETLQIVCGAPNVAAGQYIILAKIGCELPGGLAIKKSKIRGLESFGMICSLSELGVEKKYIPEEYQNGIYYFSDHPKLGTNALAALNLQDAVLDLNLTPNRGDLMSMIGVAIEAGAVLNRPLKPWAEDLFEQNGNPKLDVKVVSKDCVGYYAQTFENVQIKPSPWWLISRLVAFGVRPINNVVDITNYILALFGQPLHAFDQEKLGSEILVRNALKNETIITLDGNKRNLVREDLVITDGKKPVAIAGVMGGADTEITDATNKIVIEAAVFDPMAIRRTSQRLGLRSEASARYERGIDINRTKKALAYAGWLLRELAGAKPAGGPAFAGTKEIPLTWIPITEANVTKLLGIEIKKPEMIDIFRRLQFEIKDGKELLIGVPNRRSDIKIKNDLIEELGRIHGYENLPNILPASSIAGALTESQKAARIIRSALVGMGLNEVITYSLVNEGYNSFFTYNQVPGSKAVKLLNPMTQDRAFLRQGLTLSLVENAEYCFSRKMKDLAIFEIGKSFYQDFAYHGTETLAILLANRFAGTPWKNENENADFFLIKGILENLFAKLRIEVEFRPLERECAQMHPARSASIFYQEENIGFVGCLHPKFTSERGLDTMYVAELKLEKILGKESKTLIYQPISKFPTMERDIAVVVSNEIPAQALVDTIRSVDRKLITDVQVFDVYTGENVESDQKSIALHLGFSSNEPLTEELVTAKMNKIVKELVKNHQAKLRS